MKLILKEAIKMKNKDLLKYALEALKNSYSPYSNYKVGAAILLKNGKIVKGTNIENASYGLTNCAERSALFTTYSLGYRKEDILGIAIASLSNEPASPCGACRQVINELMDQDAFVVYGNDLDIVYEMKVKDLLPGAFSKENL
jgi:cytidine deaminase